jgi:hypothetical protein
MSKRFILLAFSLIQTLTVSYAQDSEGETEPKIHPYYLKFAPNPKTSVDIFINSQGVGYTLRIMKNSLDPHTEIKYKFFQNIEEVNPPDFIMIDDFDFNGDLDFAIKSRELGMVGNNVYGILLYSREKKNFVAIPDPINGFVSLRVDKEKKRLLYTCWKGRMPITCATKLDKMK